MSRYPQEEFDAKCLLAESYQQKAEEADRANRYVEALDLHRHALAIYEALEHREGIARISGNMGLEHRMLGSFEEAIECISRSLQGYEELGDRKGVARQTSNMGLVYDSKSDHTQALEYYRRSLAISEEVRERGYCAHALGNIAFVLSTLGSYAEALEYFHRAIAIHQDLANTQGVANATLGIGNIYAATGNYPSALEYYYRVLEMCERNGNKLLEASVSTNIGIVYEKTGEFKKALERYHAVLVFYEQMGDRPNIALVAGNIGVIHWREKDYSRAIELFNRSRSIYHELGNIQNATFIAGNIITVLIDGGLFDEAERLLEEVQQIKVDSIECILQRERSKASIQEHHAQLDAATQTLQSAATVAKEHALLDSLATIHAQLRDLCLKRNDLPGYVEHNNEYSRITEEINGKDTATKLAMQEAERSIAKERQTHEQHLAILYSTLPKHIADRVIRGEQINDHHENVVVIFLDIVGFTTLSSTLSSTEVVKFLSTIFSSFDAICERHGVTKIKTIGDSYMAVSFPSESSSSQQQTASVAERAASAALEMLDAVSHIVSPNRSPVEVRLGVHCGAVTAGVIGTERLQYDVWGDTVNVASRMESTGEPGKIHVSEQFASFLASPLATLGASARNDIPHLRESGAQNTSEVNEREPVIPNEVRNEEPGTWHLALRGDIEVKGKGRMLTYWLERSL